MEDGRAKYRQTHTRVHKHTNAQWGGGVLEVGERVDRVSGTKPTPKINAVPVSLSVLWQQRRVWGPAAGHRNNMSSASSLP